MVRDKIVDVFDGTGISVWPLDIVYSAITIYPPVNALRAWLRFNRTVRGCNEE